MFKIIFFPERGTKIEPEEVKLKKVIGMWDCVGIMVNSIIGSGIFVSPKIVLNYVGSPGTEKLDRFTNMKKIIPLNNMVWLFYVKLLSSKVPPILPYQGNYTKKLDRFTIIKNI